MMIDSSNIKPKSYKVGLCLAGAATGGAFSAGVMDFFIEAMNEWERQKKFNNPEVPPWDVSLKEIIGTSAGGITSTLSVASLNMDFEPLSNRYQYINPSKNPDPLEPKNNPLFRTWVKEMNADRLLNNDDLKSKSKDKVPTVKSVLNSDFMREVAYEVIQTDYVKPDLPKWASKVSLSLTATNLRGIPYSINIFNSGSRDDEYNMRYYGDYSQFVVTTSPDTLPPKLRSSKFVLDAAAPRNLEELHKNWKHVVDCSRATAAFPVGFPTVQLKTPYSHYNTRLGVAPNWAKNKEKESYSSLSSDNTKSIEDPKTLVYSAVDGGAVNNEPFGILEKLMEERYEGKHLKPDSQDSWASIILIDPFPELGNDNGVIDEGMSIGRMLGALLPSLLGQASFKLDEIKQATRKDNMAKFLLKPNRHLVEKPEYELATGTMGHFGGILDEKLRLHDFQLGRANCKDFLKNTFCIKLEDAKKNDFFSQYADYLKKVEEENKNKKEPIMIPIIPVVGKAAEPILMPEWPIYTHKERDGIKEHVLGLSSKRLERMTELFFEEIGFVKDWHEGIMQWFKNRAAAAITPYIIRYFRGLVEKSVDDALNNFEQK